MKFLIQLIIIALLAFVFELFLPWWSVAFAATLGGYFLNSKINFLAGFLGVALLWISYAFMISSNATAPLADRVAAILFVNKTLLIIITGIIGGLVGGFAAMAGGALKKEKRSDHYY
jgi:hypothetical protein